MDKNAIKKFAVWARRELISRVSQRAAWYGITEKDPIDDKATVFHGKVLTESEIAQRRALIARIRTVGFQQVMEEVAYTWFNRFIALRFMEVNGYLPSYTRVFSDDNGAFNPQILKDAIHLELDGLDMEKVYAMEEADDTEGLFKYLLITQCNDLNRMLPAMFERIADYTELLFPDFLLREGSVAHQMVTTIPEEDWKDAVQIIGWLYQYYNAEPKDEVFAALKKNIKISKEKIPAATQLFTPDWIVRYMVENSLGRLWVEGHPNDELKSSWKYYLEEAPQEPEVETQLATIRAEYAQIDPALILCADPCMGSGHILVYMFDVLMQIYLSYGYTTNEAVESIVHNNLWGMDIDDRAAQLAYFAVMMKAQQYDHRWLAKQVHNPVQPHVFALQDSGDWFAFEGQMHRAFSHHPSLFEDASIKTAKVLFETFADAKEYGSIIQPDITLEELDMLEKVLDEMQQQSDLMDFVTQADAITLMKALTPLILQCRALVQKYDIIVTNPPYMGGNGMNSHLSDYVKTNYAGWHIDLYTCFLAQSLNLMKVAGYAGFMTSYTWMFLNTFSQTRIQLMSKAFLQSLVQPEYHSFFAEAFVPICTFVFRNIGVNYNGVYVRLEQFYGADLQEKKFLEATLNQDSCAYLFHQCTNTFSLIPGSPIAYWLTEPVLKAFTNGIPLSDVAEPRQGMATADNDRFLRLWHEVGIEMIGFGFSNSEDAKQSGKRWFPYCKGGAYRKWSGNTEYLVNWRNDGEELRNFKGSVIRNPSYYFKTGMTWGSLTVSDISFRYVANGFLFDSKGPMCFAKDVNQEKYLLGLVNSKVAMLFLSVLAPTMDYSQGPVGKIPYFPSDKATVVGKIVDACIELSTSEWDSFETSWGFQQHPLVALINRHPCFGEYHGTLISGCFELWQVLCKERFRKLKANEEELNRIFIGIYGLQDELSPDVDDKDVTVRKADLGRDIRSLISYAVGCMLGRYSLDKPGLAFAGGTWNESQYVTYHTDHDGILPITDDEYFDDDIVGMFIDWIRTVYGEETLEANLKFIADTLGGKDNPREVIRQYFLNDFYKDHLKIYQKRPIYWLFDSGKKNGFKCLIYMHRYQPDTIARIRTDYLHETQARYRNAIETLERQSANASTGERVKMTKRLASLKAQAEEARVYEEKIHHLADQMIKIDLDDGVKVNYAKFADVLAPIK